MQLKNYFSVGSIADQWLATRLGRRVAAMTMFDVAHAPGLREVVHDFRRLGSRGSDGSGPLFHARASGTPREFLAGYRDIYLYRGEALGLYETGDPLWIHILNDNTDRCYLITVSAAQQAGGFTYVRKTEYGLWEWGVVVTNYGKTHFSDPRAVAASSDPSSFASAMGWGTDWRYQPTGLFSGRTVNAGEFFQIGKSGEPQFTYPNDINNIVAEYEWMGAIRGWMMSGFTRACHDAMEQLPKLGSNSFANVLEVAGTLKDVFTADFTKSLKGLANKKLGKRLADQWLSYRYVYNTTKSDIEELSSLAKRLVSLPSGPVTVGGKYNTAAWEFRFTCEVDLSKFIPSNLLEASKTFNMRLSAYNVWDLIPYSFIVDWFIPVGEWLQQAENFRDFQELTPEDIWCSATRCVTHDDGSSEDYYFRVPLSALPQSTAAYISYMGDPVSKRTLGMRIADTFALLMPK